MAREMTVFYFRRPGIDVPERIRTVTLDGNPWFVAADVCRALALRGDVSVVCRRVDRVDRRVIDTPTQDRGQRKAPAVTVVSEAGLYKLVLRSDKPEARAFQDWVTRDVLPAIRKDGAYVMGEEKLNDPSLSLSDLEQIQETINGLLTKKAELLEQRLADAEERARALEVANAVMAPKAALAEAHFAQSDTVSLTRFFRTLDGVNAAAAKRSLARLGYLYRHQSGTYRVYSAHRGKLFVEKRHPDYPTAVDIFLTQAGQTKVAQHAAKRELIMRAGY